MAEIKNNFLQSKMNKDLDDRLIPNGEYRDALNISVGKSESSDIGTAQNVQGNLSILEAEEVGLTCIGFHMDNQNNRIYRFLTDYTDPSPSAINMAPDNTIHKITVYDFNTAIYSTLIEGAFLNFSTTNLMIGINLLEGLLFWTDNRNQPRKINYANCINNPTYYTTETQISVAKYAPVESPSMFIEVDLIATGTDNDGLTILVEDNSSIVEGMTLISLPSIEACDYITVLSVTGTTEINLYSAPATPIEAGQKLKFLISTMSNMEDDPMWPGDPAYLESRYVRFSYRFKFDDNEYSIIAPFTQIAFVPNQKGYFIDGDEQAAFRSTIIKWMENNTNNIKLLIPLPDTGSRIWESYKIKAIEILYKESNSLALKVLDSIKYSTVSQFSPDTNIYVYNYQSQKPYKTLPEDQITRVYDKVPVRSLTQEISGNRVMYGNFFTTYSAPSSINYNVSIQAKQDIFTNFIEYPNHTLKQNRNYQVGFILADKFGRQSPVILSTVDLTKVGDGFGGSTIYSPYEKKSLDENFVRCWPGNALTLLVNSPIQSTRDISGGTPGLYAEQQGNGFAVKSSTIDNGKFTYEFDLDEAPSGTPNYPNNIPFIGDYLRGKYTDYVLITDVEWVISPVPPSPPFTTNDRNDFPDPPYGNYIITTEAAINDLYIYNDSLPIDTKYAYQLNQIGWYSYKVVVKQREQEYYNVYLPGMLDGYPINQTSGSQVVYNLGTPSLENGINQSVFPVNETGKTAHTVLINDNINKVPRDLAEVGPDQKQYRSSVELYGRVENYYAEDEFIGVAYLVPTAKATYIDFDLTIYPQLLAIVRPGDSIYCITATDTATPWYENAFITSVEESPTAGFGRINFSPGQPMQPVWTSPLFVIKRAENIQYYPIRKPDIVNTIAYGTDFNFLPNSVENIFGTAGRNFYQLQSNPLVGRISTSKPIGVTAASMIPTLGIYETSPTQSLLELFWETSSTGLISDLNWDINTGFDGAYATTPKGFRFIENQNPAGTNFDPADTGEPDCPYITDEFYILNNTNVPINAVCTLVSVTDSTSANLDVTNRFELVQVGSFQYRVRIKATSAPFVFVYDNPTQNLFNFTLSATYVGITSLLTFSGELQNIAPRFGSDEPNYYDRFINITATDIVTLDAVNGAFGGSTEGLYWTIESSTAPGDYFAINSATGLLSLVDPVPQLGTYYLTIKVQDAATFTTSPPSVLVTPLPAFSSKFDTINIIISIGQQPVEDGLQYLQGTFSPVANPDAEGLFLDSIFGVYVGAVAPDLGQEYIDIFPVLPNGDQWTNSNFVSEDDDVFDLTSNPVNVAWVNGQIGQSDTPNPTGLTKGSLRIKVYNRRFPLSGPDPGTPNVIQTAVLIYHRVDAQSAWNLVKDDNYVGTTTQGTWVTDASFVNDQSYIITGETYSGNNWISLQVSTPGEYLFAIKTIDPGNGSPVGVVVEDASYYYNRIPNPSIVPTSLYKYVNPFVPRERFAMAFTSPLTPFSSNVAYDGFSETEAFSFTTTGTITEVTNNEKFKVNLATVGLNQIVPGVWATKVGDTAGTIKVFGINYTTGEIELTAPGIPGAPLTVGNQIIFRALQPLGNSSTIIQPLGNVWASAKDATYVKQFYNEGELTSLWNPPFNQGNRFYNFKSSVFGNPTYSPVPPFNSTVQRPNARVTGWNSAQFGSTGNVITTNPLNGFNIKTTKSANNEITSNGGLVKKYERYAGINALTSYWEYYNTWAEIDEITSTSFKITNASEGDYITWATDCTTPTLLNYPNTTVPGPFGGEYEVTDLDPNTIYYVLLYKNNVAGYINGEYHPIKVTTLPA